MLCNQLSGQLAQVFVNEIQKHVLPVVGARLDGIKAQIQNEIAQKLSITDRVIKENIVNICKSKVTSRETQFCLSSVGCMNMNLRKFIF